MSEREKDSALKALPEDFYYTQRPPEHRFTYQYAQPREYHFCLDSIIFAYFLSKKLDVSSYDASQFRALDLCAGCGVVGLELSYYHTWIEHFDFVEVQDVFQPYFLENLKITRNDSKNYRFLHQDIRDLLKDSKCLSSYDFIVSNPPYFRTDEGASSPNLVKQRARFFENMEFSELIETFLALLKPAGRAYFLMRSGTHHGRSDEEELCDLLQNRAQWKIAADVRGTRVVELLRNA